MWTLKDSLWQTEELQVATELDCPRSVVLLCRWAQLAFGGPGMAPCSCCRRIQQLSPRTGCHTQLFNVQSVGHTPPVCMCASVWRPSAAQPARGREKILASKRVTGEASEALPSYFKLTPSNPASVLPPSHINKVLPGNVSFPLTSLLRGSRITTMLFEQSFSKLQ